MMTAAQLNEVAKLIKSDDKTVVISACIKFFMDEGMSIQDAYDHVLGAGAYKRAAEVIQNSLKGAA